MTTTTIIIAPNQTRFKMTSNYLIVSGNFMNCKTFLTNTFPTLIGATMRLFFNSDLLGTFRGSLVMRIQHLCSLRYAKEVFQRVRRCAFDVDWSVEGSLSVIVF